MISPLRSLWKTKFVISMTAWFPTVAITYDERDNELIQQWRSHLWLSWVLALYWISGNYLWLYEVNTRENPYGIPCRLSTTSECRDTLASSYPDRLTTSESSLLRRLFSSTSMFLFFPLALVVFLGWLNTFFQMYLISIDRRYVQTVNFWYYVELFLALSKQ